MADLVQSIQDMLKEETWTRATISNYTQNNLKELANIVEQARNEKCEKEENNCEVCNESEKQKCFKCNGDGKIIPYGDKTIPKCIFS